MRMNFGITAQGPQNDFGNALLQGMRLKGLKGEIDQRNALAAAMQQHGAGALSGDQNALNALAAVGPQGFQVASQSRAQHAAEALREREFAAQQADRQARLGLARAAGARAASEHAARMSAIELQKEQAESLKQAAAAREAMQRGPEAWERWNDQFPEFENVAFDDAPMAISMIDGVVSELEKYTPQSPEGKLTADLRAGAITQDQFDAANSGGLSAAEAQIQRLMETGISREDAIKIADSAIRTESGLDGNMNVVDLTQWTPPSPSAPLQSTPVEPGGDISLKNATGVRGAAQNVANTVSDVAGFGQPFDANADTTSALDTLNTQTVTAMAQATAGRPNAYLVKMFEELGVKPNSLTMGSEGAERKIKEGISYMDAVIMDQQELLRMGGLTPSRQAEANTAIRTLSTLRNRWQGVLDKSSGSGTKKTKSGISWSVSE